MGRIGGPNIGKHFAARALALCLLAALLLAGTALGEVSREGLVGEWLFEGEGGQTNNVFPRISKNSS